MVNFLRKKNSSVKVCILKNRKLDFFRINPFCIIKRGINHLIKKGFFNKNDEYQKDNPNYFVTPAFIVHWSETRFNDNNIHIGFTVSIKSISKRANKRNLVRRRLKACVNDNIRNFDLFGYDFVFTARSTVLNLEYEEIDYHMKRALKSIENRIKNK